MVAVFDTATFLFYLVIISKMETVQTKNPHTRHRQTLSVRVQLSIKQAMEKMIKKYNYSLS